jgi:hypothetical protein
MRKEHLASERYWISLLFALMGPRPVRRGKLPDGSPGLNLLGRASMGPRTYIRGNSRLVTSCTATSRKPVRKRHCKSRFSLFFCRGIRMLIAGDFARDRFSNHPDLQLKRSAVTYFVIEHGVESPRCSSGIRTLQKRPCAPW